MTALRLLESLHGHLALLAAAALLHPAILLRKGQPLSRGARWSVALTAVAVMLAFGSGLLIYPEYVARVRVGLFLRNARAGFLFESKEHIAFAVLALTAGAAACAWWAPRQARALRQAAAATFALAALLCVGAVAMGTYIAAVHGFGSAP